MMEIWEILICISLTVFITLFIQYEVKKTLRRWKVDAEIIIFLRGLEANYNCDDCCGKALAYPCRRCKASSLLNQLSEQGRKI